MEKSIEVVFELIQFCIELIKFSNETLGWPITIIFFLSFVGGLIKPPLSRR